MANKSQNNFPFLYTTEQIIRVLRPLIRDKTVCDVGCRSGEAMVYFKKYAEKVVGIEMREDMYRIAKNKGLDVVLGDARVDTIPTADVYYVWVEQPYILPILERIKRGIIVVGNTIKENGETISQEVEKYLDKNAIRIMLENIKAYEGHSREYCLSFIKYD